MKRIQVKTIDQLKKLIKGGKHEYYISLKGQIRSSKYIKYSPKAEAFYIFNYVDETEQFLSEKEIMDHSITNIGKAMKLGALICEY